MRLNLEEFNKLFIIEDDKRKTRVSITVKYRETPGEGPVLPFVGKGGTLQAALRHLDLQVKKARKQMRKEFEDNTEFAQFVQELASEV